jgi:hypothetical protein
MNVSIARNREQARHTVISVCHGGFAIDFSPAQMVRGRCAHWFCSRRTRVSDLISLHGDQRRLVARSYGPFPRLTDSRHCIIDWQPDGSASARVAASILRSSRSDDCGGATLKGCKSDKSDIIRCGSQAVEQQGSLHGQQVWTRCGRHWGAFSRCLRRLHRGLVLISLTLFLAALSSRRGEGATPQERGNLCCMTASPCRGPGGQPLSCTPDARAAFHRRIRARLRWAWQRVSEPYP